MDNYNAVEVLFLPCPFCGKQPKVYADYLIYSGEKEAPKYYLAHCVPCHLRMNHWTPPELAHLWNQRADLTNDPHRKSP